MKKIIVFCFVLLSIGMVGAKPVTVQNMQRVAEKVLPGRQLNATMLDGMCLFTSTDGHGFVLVAADDCVPPLLAYSLSSEFRMRDLSPEVAYWLNYYSRQITSCVARGASEPAGEWDIYLDDNYTTTSTPVVAPLCATTWSQNPYYNSLCPFDTANNVQTPTGCGATAMAQVMKYWNHPITGHGSRSYIHPVYGQLSAQFDTTTYQWAQMPNELTATSSDTQVMAVATLMQHAGIAVEMDYGPFGSSSNLYSYPSIESALNRHFYYRSTIHHMVRRFYTDSEWKAYLMQDLDAGRPIIYRAADELTEEGHLFVCDGYDSDTLFHFNWGWGGYCDGYYSVDALDLEAGLNYSLGQMALFGIEPDTVGDTTVTISALPQVEGTGTVTGGGTFTAYDSEVTLLANAAENYLFTRWNDGTTDNPRTFLATDSRSDTAIFEPISGDTIGYCFDNNLSGFGSSEPNPTYWGIRLRPSVLSADHVLQGIQMYIGWFDPDNGNTYYVSIYSGDPSPTTLRYADTLHVFNSGWQYFQFDSMVLFPQNQSLWITIYCNELAYAAPISIYRGNADGLYWNGNNGDMDGWYSLAEAGVCYYSHMLRAVMAHDVPYHNVTVSTKVASRGSVAGGGLFAHGSSATVVAIPNDGWRFSNWNGDTSLTENPYTFVVISDSSFEARFERQRYVVQLTADPADLGTVSGSGTYNSGSNVTIRAHARQGAHFTGWSDGPTESQRSIVLISDTSLTAYFEADSVPDTTDHSGIRNADGSWLQVSVNGRIVSVDADEARYYDAAGRLVGTGRRAEMPAPGVYMVCVGTASIKIVIY